MPWHGGGLLDVGLDMQQDAGRFETGLRRPSGPVPWTPRSCRPRRSCGRSASGSRRCCGARRPRGELVLTSFLTASLASRRRLRIATLACSPSPRTTFGHSLRRSSVMAGIGTRIRSPCEAGSGPGRTRGSPSRSWRPSSHGATPMVRVEQRQVGDLRHRHHRAVVFDLHGVEQHRVGAAGAHLGQGWFAGASRAKRSSSARRSS